jgi:hypothetical protein
MADFCWSGSAARGRLSDIVRDLAISGFRRQADIRANPSGWRRYGDKKHFACALAAHIVMIYTFFGTSRRNARISCPNFAAKSAGGNAPFGPIPTIRSDSLEKYVMQTTMERAKGFEPSTPTLARNYDNYARTSFSTPRH